MDRARRLSRDERLVGQVAEIRDDGIGITRHELQHQDAEQLLLRVNPEVGVGRAAPAEIPDRSRRLRFAEIHAGR